MNDPMHKNYQQETGLFLRGLAVCSSPQVHPTGMIYQSGEVSFAGYGSLCRARTGVV